MQKESTDSPLKSLNFEYDGTCTLSLISTASEFTCTTGYNGSLCLNGGTAIGDEGQCVQLQCRVFWRLLQHGIHVRWVEMERFVFMEACLQGPLETVPAHVNLVTMVLIVKTKCPVQLVETGKLA